MKIKYKFGHGFKANRHNLRVVTFDIPVDDNGIYDSMAQQEISNAYLIIEQYRHETSNKLDTVLNQRVEY